MNKDLFEFLNALKENNNKEWFDANRKNYEDCKANLVVFLSDVIAQTAKFDKSIIGVDAKKSIFRINRDVRFSKNKNPYKTNMGALLSAGGKKGLRAGYYLHFEPNATLLGAGIWMPETAVLNKVRQEIDYNSKEFLKIVENKNVLELFGGIDKSESLKTMPRGYDVTLPYAEYLKLKSFTFFKKLSNKEVMSKDFNAQVVNCFKAMQPLNNFLNRVIDEVNE